MMTKMGGGPTFGAIAIAIILHNKAQNRTEQEAAVGPRCVQENQKKERQAPAVRRQQRDDDEVCCRWI